MLKPFILLALIIGYSLPLAVYAEKNADTQNDKGEKSTETIKKSSGSATMPKQQWAYQSMLALRYNPLGLQDEFFIGYKKKLYNHPKNDLLFGKSYWWAGMIGRASPQFANAGFFVKTLPLQS